MKTTTILPATNVNSLIVCEVFYDDEEGFCFSSLEFPIIAWRITESEGDIDARPVIPEGDFQIEDFSSSNNEVTYLFRFPDGNLYDTYNVGGLGFPDGPCTLESVKKCLSARLETRIGKTRAEEEL
jgi:hypothetical protein